MIAGLLGVLVGSACTTAGTALPPPTTSPPPATVEIRDARFVAAIAAAAADYRSWGRVDERPNIAPQLCRQPLPQDYGAPSHVRLSQVPDGPHGTKLYYLWASRRDDYLGLTETATGTLPDGFAIVKESFAATPTPPTTQPVNGTDPPPIRYLETAHGKQYTGAASGLFVMTKVAAGDGTDDGWVYGTVSPAGEVTSAGRVETCMGCHEAAPHGRLFGLQPTQPRVEPAR